ncbi:guanine nucleotide exchange factor for Rab-3A-like [Littorina saxatilis]|uniref:GDP/GTP exchange factor Sec2 N-terminal domain-containing protein n=1 Tax=Littorina saxatilis TaxID=31220 RepID=A0AAN9GHK8_9CAEN
MEKQDKMSHNQAPFVVATSNPAGTSPAQIPRSPAQSPTSPSPTHSPVILTAHINSQIQQQQAAESLSGAAAAAASLRRSSSDACQRRQRFADSPQGSVQLQDAVNLDCVIKTQGGDALPLFVVAAGSRGSSGSSSPAAASRPTAVHTSSNNPAPSINGHATSSASGVGSGSVHSTDTFDSYTTNSSTDASPSDELEGVEIRRKTRPLRQAQSEVPASFSRMEKHRQSLSDARENAYQRMMAELSKAQKELQLKDEECEKLSNLRSQMEAEVYELTAALFDEANNQVQVAEMKRDAAEKKAKEYVEKVDVLQSEVAALKHLVVTSTPSAPNKHLHPQICQTSPKKEKSSKPFWKSHRRSTSHHEFTKESRDKAEEAQQGSSKVKEMDTVCFDEFQRWKLQPSVTDANSLFLNRIILEDIQPCLNFHNKKLAERVLLCVEQNTLTIEPIPGDSSFPRKCSLSDMHKLCNYKINLGEGGEWFSISQMCRNRIAAVCDYYTYIRYVVQGLVKSSDKDIFHEITRLRLQMSSARLGC